MNFDQIYKHCKCCICEGPLPETPIVAQLNVDITWPAPKWGNLITGVENKGLAFICDNCSETTAYADIKYAVEFTDDDQVVYHKLKWENDGFQLDN